MLQPTNQFSLPAIIRTDDTLAQDIARKTSKESVSSKKLSKTVGINIGELLPPLDKEVGKAQGVTSGGPKLNAPSNVLSQDATKALKKHLQDKLNDPDFLRSFGEQHKKSKASVNKLVENADTAPNKVKAQAEQGQPLDISELSPSEVALIVRASVLMMLLDIADTKLSNKLSIANYTAAEKSASLLKSQGMDTLSASIAGGIVGVGITIAGATTEGNALKRERGAMKSYNDGLEGALDDNTRTNLKNLLKDEQLQSRVKQAVGHAVTNSSQPVSGIVNSVGQYASALDSSDKEIKDADSKVLGTGAEDMRNNSQKIRDLIKELLRMIDSLSQSRNTTIGTVAGNIRV